MPDHPNHPDRVWPLQGASNFRDLGGYPGRDGRPLRWRRLFRSDHLGALTEQDRATLAELGVTRSFDFRGVDERANTPYEVPGLQQHSLAIEPSVVQNLQLMSDAGRALDAGAAVEVMQDTYRAFVTDYSERFARLLAHLLEDDSPSVFHCTAGKDRTGVIAAVVLRAVGVSAERVIADYAKSAAAMERLIAWYRANRPYDGAPVQDPTGDARRTRLMGAEPAWMDRVLDHLEQRHGGAERYLLAQGATPTVVRDLRARLVA